MVTAGELPETVRALRDGLALLLPAIGLSVDALGAVVLERSPGDWCARLQAYATTAYPLALATTGTTEAEACGRAWREMLGRLDSLVLDARARRDKARRQLDTEESLYARRRGDYAVARGLRFGPAAGPGGG